MLEASGQSSSLMTVFNMINVFMLSTIFSPGFYLGKPKKCTKSGYLSLYPLCLTLPHTQTQTGTCTQLQAHTQQGGSGLIILTRHRSLLSFSIISYRCIFLHVTAAITVLSFYFSLIVLTLLAFYLISASSPIKMYENGFFITSRGHD